MALISCSAQHIKFDYLEKTGEIDIRCRYADPFSDGAHWFCKLHSVDSLLLLCKTRTCPRNWIHPPCCYRHRCEFSVMISLNRPYTLRIDPSTAKCNCLYKTTTCISVSTPIDVHLPSAPWPVLRPVANGVKSSLRDVMNELDSDLWFLSKIVVLLLFNFYYAPVIGDCSSAPGRSVGEQDYVGLCGYESK